MRLAGYSRFLLAAALLVGGTVGCEEDAQPEYLFPAAWRADGLDVGEFTKVTEGPFSSDKCWAGKVDAMETVMCRFEKKEDAKAARKKGLAYVGESTGASLNSGVWLLTVADRENSDPTGKKLNQIAHVFLNHDELKPKAKPAESDGDGEGAAAKGEGEADKGAAGKGAAKSK